MFVHDFVCIYIFTLFLFISYVFIQTYFVLSQAHFLIEIVTTITIGYTLLNCMQIYTVIQCYQLPYQFFAVVCFQHHKYFTQILPLIWSFCVVFVNLKTSSSQKRRVRLPRASLSYVILCWSLETKYSHLIIGQELMISANKNVSLCLYMK
jgi:hypothetical protein